MNRNGKIITEIQECVRNNIEWQNLPVHLKQILKNTARDYERYVFNYSIKNQHRFRGNIVRKIFRNEQRYYELLVEKSVHYLNLFPYHLADIVTKGLRVTPFNYYVDMICYLLRHDKSYDTLPNFTAADCLRVLGIGRNEYLSLIGEWKTSSSRLFRKPNPMDILPKFPVRINFEPWWKVEVGYVLESDIKYVNEAERSLIDDLIDFGSQTAGKIDYEIIESLYRKGLIYLDLPISGEDRISIPPLKNFVMNRVSGDYFENLLYTVFVSADEHMTVSELAQMLQIDLDSVKNAVSLFCRLGFAQKKSIIDIPNMHPSWLSKREFDNDRPQVTPLNYHALLVNETDDGIVGEKSKIDSSPNATANYSKNRSTINNSYEYISSDGNTSDFSIINPSVGSKHEEKSESPIDSSESDDRLQKRPNEPLLSTPTRFGKRLGFIFDSTLAAFLMMGNLSPGLKNHAVTMFEVGKLCDESLNTFLAELEKVSLLDAEGEGEVSRYFTHAIILRSTIIALRNVTEGGLDLLRLECLENLDSQTRDRLLEKKYKFIISASPLSSSLTSMFTIPFFGQFYKSSDNTHIWSKLFYYHMSGYGPPSLLLTKGTVLKSLPRIFLGYGKLLVTIIHTDSYVLNSENYRNLNEQLKNGCVLVQGYGVRQNAKECFQSFPFDKNDSLKSKWAKHKGIERLQRTLNLENTCGYVTFINTGVVDIGCESFDENVHLVLPRKTSKGSLPGKVLDVYTEVTTKPNELNLLPSSASITDLLSPMDGSELTGFKRPDMKTTIDTLKSPDEYHFCVTPNNESPSNTYRSEDCNELIAKELASLDNEFASLGHSDQRRGELVSQSSIEIEFKGDSQTPNKSEDEQRDDSIGEDWTILDINFGVPLFDVDCNTRICEQIAKKLSRDENLSNLPKINADMNEKFKKFLSQCLYFEDENKELVKFGKLIPQPRINLAFDNGKMCYWAGK